MFSNRTNVTITATVNRTVSEYDVRSALTRLARDNDVTVADLAVTVQPAERITTVEMTETEHAAFTAWQASQASTTPGA